MLHNALLALHRSLPNQQLNAVDCPQHLATHVDVQAAASVASYPTEVFWWGFWCGLAWCSMSFLTGFVFGGFFHKEDNLP